MGANIESLRSTALYRSPLTAEAARRLNVSRSVVQRLWDQYQSEDSVSRRPVPGRPRATTPAEDRFLALSARRRRTTTVPQLVADHFQSIRKKNIRYYGAKSFTMQVCMQKDQLLCSPQRTTAKGTAYAGQENMFLGRSNNGLLCCSQTSPDLQWRVIQGVYWIWREQRTRYHQSNAVERHTVIERYRDEILDPYVRPYAAAIGNDFILMDDNARPYRARIVEEYLRITVLERMEWPARSPDLNPIEHLWYYLGREVAAFKSSSKVVVS
ncbi:transposable element Tcb2 transposase [Trichonephila clavipes]|nr:transposable element Tcb2 transposase [Trichonephila clavipes]